MEIRSKTLIIICVTLISLIVVLWALSQSVVLGGFVRVEEQSAQMDTNRVLVALGNDINILDAVADDWAAQPGITETLRSEEASGNLQKLGEDTFERMQFNYILLYDSGGEYLAGRGYDLDTHAMNPVPADLNILLTRDLRLFPLAKSPLGTMGIIVTQEGPLMVAMRPTGDGRTTGNPEGILLIGRYIDDREIERLSNLAQLPITIRLLNDPGLPEEFSTAFRKIPKSSGNFVERSGGDRLMIKALNIFEDSGDKTLQSYSSVNDIFGNPALILKITFTRDILAQGRSTTLYFMWLIYAAGLAFGLAILLLLETTVISRLTKLSRKVSAIREHHDGAETIEESGNDEITHLATSINGMVFALEESRHAVEGKLSQSEERYQILIESSPDGILVLDKGVIAYANAAALDLFGAPSRSQLMEMGVSRLFSSGALSLIDEGQVRTGHVKGQIFPLTQGEIIRIDGKQVPVELVGVGILYEGTPVLQLVIRDITERRREEDALRQAKKKLSILNEKALNDIRNQLFTLTGYLALSKESAVTDAEREYVRKEEKAARAISAQLAFIQNYQTMGVRPPQWQDVHRVYLFALSHISLGDIVRDDSIRNIEVYADPLLEQVFFNLLDNVIRHSGGATKIRLSYKESDDGLNLLFEDNGGGIPEPDKEKIFERGYGKGMGIGLFLAREILGITGISIHETGETGKGARFEIRVPKGYYRFVQNDQFQASKPE